METFIASQFASASWVARHPNKPALCTKWEDWPHRTHRTFIEGDERGILFTYPLTVGCFSTDGRDDGSRCWGCLVMEDIFKSDFISPRTNELVAFSPSGPVESPSLGLFQRSRDIYIRLSAVEGIPNPWNLPHVPSLRSTGSRATLDQIQAWIDTCVNTHQLCRSVSKTDTPLPTRVLDLGVDPSESAPIRLIESAGKNGRYVTLSYCWGKAKFLKTTKDNYTRHKQGILFADLPRTFQHTIRVCRALGVRYLWIDALCIIQDDSQDWAAESVRMADVYQKSFFTLSATWGDSPDCGLFQDFDTASESRIGPVALRQVVHPTLTHITHHENEFPVLTRGWCYQEHLLSRRILYFTMWEVMLQCLESTICECGSSIHKSRGTEQEKYKQFFCCPEDQHPASPSATSPDVASNFWHVTVSDYTLLRLTYSSDKLPAISGIATVIQRKTNWHYLAGLWRETLLTDLCWYVWPPPPAPPNATSSPCGGKPQKQRRKSPTWSWITIPHSNCIHYQAALLSFYQKMPIHLTLHASILDAGCTPPSSMSEVHSGFIVLECYMQQIPLTMMQALVMDLTQGLALDEGLDTPLEEGPFYLIPMVAYVSGDEWFKYTGYTALVVTPAEEGKDEMVRVGLLICHVNPATGGKPGTYKIWERAVNGKKVRIRLI